MSISLSVSMIIKTIGEKLFASRPLMGFQTQHFLPLYLIMTDTALLDYRKICCKLKEIILVPILMKELTP